MTYSYVGSVKLIIKPVSSKQQYSKGDFSFDRRMKEKMTEH